MRRKVQRAKDSRACTLIVQSSNQRSTKGRLVTPTGTFPCALGRTGRRPLKREGDGATPVGKFALRGVLYRRDRMLPPQSALPLRPIRRDDGWCDAVGDANYNRRVRHPYPRSAERLMREDDIYDIIVVLGANDMPRKQGGRVGPDLSGVNNKTRDELLKAILDPSAAIEPRFVNYMVTTKDGQVFDGVIANETPAAITLRGGTEDGDQTILRRNVAEVRASAISLMPEGLEKSINVKDMADLISYLRAGL